MGKLLSHRPLGLPRTPNEERQNNLKYLQLTAPLSHGTLSTKLLRRSEDSKKRLQSTSRIRTASVLNNQPLAEDPTLNTTPSRLSTHLSELRIENFALVQSGVIHLTPGLNVITGESGSGKSVLIDALGHILGSTASEDAVRPPAKAAVLEGRFLVAPSDRAPLRRLLLSLGLPQKAAPKDLETLTIRREISSGRSGTRSKCSLNGAATPLRVLREVGRALVDVNSQNASIGMKDSSTQLALLDRLGDGISGRCRRLRKTWKELQAARRQIQALSELADEDRRAALQKLVDDVFAAGIEEGEDVSLKRQLRQLDARRESAERCRLVSVGVGGDGGGGGILDALHDVQLHVRAVLSQEERLRAAVVNEINDGSPDLEDEEGLDEGDGGTEAAVLLDGAMQGLASAREALEDARDAVERYGRQYRFNQMEYDEAAERLQELQRLMKQHDVASADELLSKAEGAGASLDSFYQMEGRREELEADVVRLESSVAHQATQLSVARRSAGAKLRDAVQSLLGELAMSTSIFDVRLSWTPTTKVHEGITISEADAQKYGHGDCANSENTESSQSSIDGVEAGRQGSCGGGTFLMRPDGLDSVQFLFAAGPEEPLRLLSSVASGGEAARIMLAIKAAPSYIHNSTNGGAVTAGVHNNPALDTDQEDQDPSEDYGVAPIASPITVLDEIDSGIGSRLGQPIGRILRRMAAGCVTPGEGRSPADDEASSKAQVLCVSHLPQVAAHALYHVCVRKEIDGDGRMVSRFDVLSSYEDRVAEVGAMLGLGQNAAEELMRAAEN